MAKSKRPSLTPEDLIATLPLDVRDLVDATRATLKEIVPEATEKANAGWVSINFHHPQTGYFCGIFTDKGAVKLVFEHGVSLPDPHGLLEGAGKQVRYVLIRAPSELQSAALHDLVLASLAV